MSDSARSSCDRADSPSSAMLGYTGREVWQRWRPQTPFPSDRPNSIQLQIGINPAAKSTSLSSINGGGGIRTLGRPCGRQRFSRSSRWSQKTVTPARSVPHRATAFTRKQEQAPGAASRRSLALRPVSVGSRGLEPSRAPGALAEEYHRLAGPAANSPGQRSGITPTRDHRGEATHY